MYDSIVLGTGGIGSAALWHLARRGYNVLGIDQFEAGHDRGSSHGETRVIRKVYFEHPDYVPLLKRSYALWEEVCSGTPQTLWTRTGLVQVGPPDGEVIQGVLASAEAHDLYVEALTRSEHNARFPRLGLPPGMVSVYEPTGGVLRVERCVKAMLTQACANGAALFHDTRFMGIEKSGNGWIVHTDKGELKSNSVVACAGPWTLELLPSLAPHLHVLRKVLLWYASASNPSDQEPVFLYEMPTGVFYGFPEDDLGRLKVARHTGGHEVENPLLLDRELHSSDHLSVDAFCAEWIGGIKPAAPCAHAVCMYTMSPDLHFVLGQLQPGLAVAAGLSGHGYKFAPVLGEALADMVTVGHTDLPISALTPERLLG